MSKIKNVFLVIIIPVLIASYNRCFAQRSATDSIKVAKSYWATLGLGISSLGGPVAAATANAELWHNAMVTISSQAETNNLAIGLFTPPPGHYTHVSNQNLLVGKIFKQKVTFISASAGLGVVNAIAYDDSTHRTYNRNAILEKVSYNEVRYNLKNQKAINIPIIVQGYIVVAEPVGFGFNAYLNLNRLRTTAGVTINIALGRMTTRDRQTNSSEHPSRHQRRPPPLPFFLQH